MRFNRVANGQEGLREAAPYLNDLGLMWRMLSVSNSVVLSMETLVSLDINPSQTNPD
jgi:hypothetical protein